MAKQELLPVLPKVYVSLPNYIFWLRIDLHTKMARYMELKSHLRDHTQQVSTAVYILGDL